MTSSMTNRRKMVAENTEFCSLLAETDSDDCHCPTMHAHYDFNVLLCTVLLVKKVRCSIPDAYLKGIKTINKPQSC